MSSWLITGGAGFIGSNFLRHAANAVDSDLVVLDLLTYAGNLANISDLIGDRRISFVRGDICDSALLDRLFSEHDFDRVVHFAAESHVDRSIIGPGEFLRTNVDGTFTLLQAARKHWGEHDGDRLFLHVSTDEVYGDLEPDAPAFTEVTPYKPSSPYSASKAAADHLAHAWHRTYDLPVIVTNCSNNYGPWQFPEKFIPLMIVNATENKPLPVYGDGQQIRDWLHVQDHCEALMSVCSRGRVGETYNIGGNDERTNLQVLETLCDSVDRKLERPPGTSRALMQHVVDRPGHDRRYAIDTSKIATELDWQPRFKFEEALPDIIDWYLAHAEWTAAIRSGEYQEFYERQYGKR